MDPYEQYLADIAYEDYLKQVEEEDVNQALARNSPSQKKSPFQKETQNSLGADYNESVLSNIGKAIVDIPESLYETGKGVYNFLNPWANDGQGGPIDTIRRAGAERSLNTVGTLAGGTAGAAALAPIGAGWGATLGPIGALAGGALGGGAGFGLGVLGFDVTRDAATGDLKPTDQYIKDLAYNTSQGTILSGGASLAGKLIPTKGKLTKAESRTVSELNKLEPGIQNKLNEALAQGADDPFLMNKSLGELTGSDPLKNVQRTLARSSPESFGKATEAFKNRADAQLKYLNNLDDSLSTIDDAQNSVREGVTAGGEQISNLIEKLPPSIDVAEAGGMIREALKGSKETLKGQVSKAFEGIGTGIVDTAQVADKAKGLLPKYFKEVGAQPNQELVNLINGLTPEGSPTGLLDAAGKPIVKAAPYTMQEVQALRSKALELAGDSDLRVARVAGEVAESLKQSVDDAIKAGTVPPQEAAAWKEGVRLRKQQGDLFESSATPAKKVLSKQPYGEFKIPESAIPNQYFKPGERGVKEALGNYKQTIGATSEALEPIYRYAADSFRNYVTDANGNINASKANKWLKRHASALDELPELKSQFSNIEQAQRFLDTTFGKVTRSAYEVEKGALQQFLQVDPEKAIEAMLSGKDGVRKTINTVRYLKSNDIDAVGGLRRGVIEHLKKKAFIPDGKVGLEEASLKGGGRFDGTIRAGVLKAEWERIKPALEKSKLFTDSQMRGFDYLYKDASSQLSIEKAKMPGGSDTIQNNSTLAAIEKAASRTFLTSFIKGPTTRFVAEVLTPILKQIPEGKFLAKLEEALFNPQMARELLTKASNRTFAKTVEKIFTEEVSAALGSAESKDPSEKIILPSATPAPIKKPSYPKQQAILSKSSFPTPQDLTNPPTAGTLKKTSFNLQEYIASQPPETRARIRTESAGDPYARSPKGAEGLSQLMPATAKEIAAELGETYVPLRAGMSPEQQAASIDQNVRFGNYYLNKQLKRFKNPSLAWAAYNAGPGRVEEAMKMSGTSRDINKILSNLPKGVQRETLPYIASISRGLAGG